MKKFLMKRHSIAVKVSLTIALLLTTTLGLLWVILQSNLDNLLNTQIDAFGNSITRQVANASGELVLADDLLSLNVMVNNLAQDPNIAYAAIYSKDNRLLAPTGSVESSFYDQQFYTAPIYFKDLAAGSKVGKEVIVGKAQVALNKDPISDAIRHSMTLMGLATSLMLGLSLVITIALARNLTRPVIRIKDGTDAITSGKLDYRINEKRKDEIGDLIKSFNQMARNLEEKKQVEEAFSRFVSDDVADSILSNLNMPRMPDSYVDASVLFVDIVGFTTMCENKKPQDVGKLLNYYFFYIHQACKLYNGTVDKYMGDGAMVLFGVPQQDLKHSFHAICAAQLFINILHNLNRSREEKNLPVAHFRLGLHSGSMLAGAIGSLERMQYTVIGDTVNVSARLCSESDKNKLLIGDSVMADSLVRKAVIVESPRAMQVKGRMKSLQTYIVSELKGNYQQLIERQTAHILSLKVDA